MKKTILTITLMTIVLGTFAQVDFGLKGGYNSSKLATGNPLNYTYSDFKTEAKAGYNIGVFTRIKGKRFFLQPELLYCEKNSVTNSTTSTGATGNQEVNLKTIQIPVLVGLKILDLKVVSVRAFTGPAMSIVNNGSTNISNIPDYKPENFKNNIWDYQLGASLDVLLFSFDVRYDWGLSNISEGDITNIGFVDKGNTLTLSLGIKIF
jgi:hypothetical protein